MPLTIENIRRIDRRGMHKVISAFPHQVRDAVSIGTNAALKLSVRGIRHIVLTGMGGSAIGGDLLRSYLSDTLTVPLSVNRQYLLPAFVDHSTLVIVSSYSGNTEETLSAYRDAAKKRARILCITSGGEVARRAIRRGDPLIRIPGGYAPRAALGYSFFPLLLGLTRLGFVSSRSNNINETMRLLESRSAVFSDPSHPDNRPLAVAERLHGSLPIIYAGGDRLDALVVRWRGQINENAKQLAYGNVFPEMNHNELVGWQELPDLLRKAAVVFLRDKGVHPRNQRREELTLQLVGERAKNTVEVWSEGRSLLARLFSLVYFGDWVSFYLAILNGVDPEPVRVIDLLKSELGKL
jgi:glucose/mannose-6-phosphate isomerase